jgi:hypothetical protein
MNEIAKMIGILFMSRTYSHMCHLKTSSYSKHKALNAFYEEVVELTDTLAEASQGKYGKLDIPYVPLKGDVNDPIEGLKSHMAMIGNLKKKCDTPFIDNIIQEIEALYSKTLYLMKELS